MNKKILTIFSICMMLTMVTPVFAWEGDNQRNFYQSTISEVITGMKANLLLNWIKLDGAGSYVTWIVCSDGYYKAEIGINGYYNGASWSVFVNFYVTWYVNGSAVQTDQVLIKDWGTNYLLEVHRSSSEEDEWHAEWNGNHFLLMISM